MPTQNASELKAKILFILKRRGPSLPVHIANETKLSMLFSSAFLSELVAEKKIKMSNMRVGNSPLYFIPGQEYMLEKFSNHLKSREKDAFFILKEKEFLEDSTQEPAIRVALRAIKDFAKPFKKEDKIIWRYFKIPEEDFESKEKIYEEKQIEIKTISSQIPKGVVAGNVVETKIIPKELVQEKTEKPLGIFYEKKVKKTSKTKTPKKKVSQKKNDKFFNKIKEFLAKKSIEILDIESFSKNDLILKVDIAGEEKLLVAYNKKRITEADIIKAYKKASELNLKYIILSLGEPLKKLNSFIEAIRNLGGIEKVE